MEQPILILKTPKMKKESAELTKRDFAYTFLNGQKYVSLPPILKKREFRLLSIDFTRSPDFLTHAEIADVEASWKEIEEGRAKKFKSVDEFLEELKT